MDNQKTSFWWLLIPAIAAVLVYLPVVNYGLVWDDTIFLRDLPLYRQEGGWLAALYRSFVLSPNYYRPVPLLTFMAELRLGGLIPSLFHLTNLLIHAVNTFLFTVLARSLIKEWKEDAPSNMLALAAGMMYALHPALLEGVVFISSRFDLLMTMFLLLALLADLRLTGKMRPVLVGIAFFLAAMSKEMAVAFALLLPIWHLARRLPSIPSHTPKSLAHSAWQTGDAKVYLSVFLAGLVYLGVRLGSLGYLLMAETGREISVGNPFEHFLLVGRSLAEYLKLMVWPFTSLSPLHFSVLPLPAASLGGWAAWVALALLLAGLVYLWRGGYRSTLLFLATLIALIPVSNLLPLELGGGAIVAERFLQFPLALFILAVVLFSLEKGWVRDPRLALAAMLWLLLSVATIQLLAPNWRDNLTLWQWAARRVPQSAMPYTNLSLEYNDQGDYQAGLALAEQALARDENEGNAWNNAGLALFGLERYEEAEHAFTQAIQRQPENALYWNNLAGTLREQGKLAEAEQMLLDQVLPRSPDLPVAHLNLGIVYIMADRPDLAAVALQEALRLLPPDMAGEADEYLQQSSEPERWLRLGDMLVVNQAWAEAMRAFEQAGALGARPIDVQIGISTVLMAQEEWDQAERLLQQTLDEYGGDARLYYSLGIIARERNDRQAALTLFNQAALLAPDWELPQQELEALQAIIATDGQP